MEGNEDSEFDYKEVLEHVDENGFLDTGVRKVLVGGPELFPDTWSDTEEIEREIHETFSESLDRYENQLIPLIKHVAEEAPNYSPRKGGLNLSRPVKINLGEGLRWYTFAIWRTFSPLLPGDPPENFDRDKLAEESRQDDAWTALQLISQLRKSINPSVAIHLGMLLERLRFDEYRSIVMQGTASIRSKKRGGQATAKATEEEKKLIVQARNDLAKSKEWPKKRAAKDIASQLRTGTFLGIDRSIDFSDDYIARL